MFELLPQILIPAAIALLIVGVLVGAHWVRRSHRQRAQEAANRRREVESRAVARRRRRESEEAAADWLHGEPDDAAAGGSGADSEAPQGHPRPAPGPILARPGAYAPHPGRGSKPTDRLH